MNLRKRYCITKFQNITLGTHRGSSLIEESKVHMFLITVVYVRLMHWGECILFILITLNVFFRMLLHTVRGPASFQALKIIDGEVCQTFRAACLQLGLLENDQHWDTTLTEASLTCLAPQIRRGRVGHY